MRSLRPTRRLAAFLLAIAVLAALAPEPALAGRARVRRVPRFAVPPLSNREICTFVKLPMSEPLDLSSVVIANVGGNTFFATHHAIVFAYAGSLAALAPYEGQVIDDTACLNLGGLDSTQLNVVATSQSIKLRQRMPRGTALRVEPAPSGVGDERAVGLVINSHWINSSSRVQFARVKVKLVRARQNATKRVLKPIFEAVASGFIKVPPGSIRTVGFSWGPGLPTPVSGFLGAPPNPEGPACVTMLISHMHERGTLFTEDLVDGDGVATRIYTNTAYDHPPALNFDPPLLVDTGEMITYACTHDNATNPKLGCEEVPGVAPGRSAAETFPDSLDGASKNCTRRDPDSEECPLMDPAYPGRTFTGRCVEANLVFGFRSWDDMCIMPGYYYDADPGAPPGHECDL
jgi:hypothetical protein